MKNLGLKELKHVCSLATLAAKEEAFAAGTFISYVRNGKLLREYPDGSVKEVIYDGSGNRIENDFSGN